MTQSSQLPHPVVAEHHPAILLPDLDMTRRYQLWWSRYGLEWWAMDTHYESVAGIGVGVLLGVPLDQVRRGVPTTVELPS